VVGAYLLLLHFVKFVVKQPAASRAKFAVGLRNIVIIHLAICTIKSLSSAKVPKSRLFRIQRRLDTVPVVCQCALLCCRLHTQHRTSERRERPRQDEREREQRKEVARTLEPFETTEASEGGAERRVVVILGLDLHLGMLSCHCSQHSLLHFFLRLSPLLMFFPDAKDVVYINTFNVAAKARLPHSPTEREDAPCGLLRLFCPGSCPVAGAFCPSSTPTTEATFVRVGAFYPDSSVVKFEVACVCAQSDRQRTLRPIKLTCCVARAEA
jgi:hypothetical protein